MRGKDVNKLIKLIFNMDRYQVLHNAGDNLGNSANARNQKELKAAIDSVDEIIILLLDKHTGRRVGQIFLVMDLLPGEQIADYSANDEIEKLISAAGLVE